MNYFNVYLWFFCLFVSIQWLWFDCVCLFVSGATCLTIMILFVCASLEPGTEYAGDTLDNLPFLLFFSLPCVYLRLCLSSARDCDRVCLCLSGGKQWVCRGRALKGHLGRHLGNKTVLLPLKSFYHSTPILHSVSAVDLLHILTPQCTQKT